MIFKCWNSHISRENCLFFWSVDEINSKPKNQLKKQIFSSKKQKNFFFFFLLASILLLHRFGFYSHEIVLIKAIWLSNFRKFQFIAFFFLLDSSSMQNYLTVCVSVNYWINDFCIENSMETVDSDTCLSITDIKNAQRSSRKPFVICIFVVFFLQLLDVSTTPWWKN